MKKPYRRAQNTRNKTVAFRITEEQHTKLVQAAKRQKISMSHYVDNCLMHFLGATK